MGFTVAAFAVVSFAQNTTAPSTNGTEKSGKMERHGDHRGEFGKGMHGRRGGGFMRELRGITLTDAQKEQLRAIHEANKPDQASMEEMHALMEAKRGGTLTADQQERMKAIREQGRAKGEQVHSQVIAILTPEQFQQVEKNRQEMKDRREQRRNERREKAPADTDKPTDN